MIVDHYVPVTFPGQASPAYALPTAPKKPKTYLFIALAVFVGLVLGCCGGLAIGANMGNKKSSSAAAPAASTPGTSATSGAPATLAAVPVASAPATPASTSPASPLLVVMPNVVGQNAAVSADQLRRLGLTNIQYGSQDTNDTVVLLLSNWTVTKQSTAAGTKVTTDTLIVLTCTKKH